MNTSVVSLAMLTLPDDICVLQSAHSSQYWTLINTLFERKQSPSSRRLEDHLTEYVFHVANSHANAGLSYLRVPLGASDFSASGECSLP